MASSNLLQNYKVLYLFHLHIKRTWCWCVIFIDSHVELLFKPWKEFLFWIIHIICKANRAIICPLFRIVHYTCMRVLFCSLILRNDFKLLNIYEITLVSRFNALVNRQCALWGIVRIKAWKKFEKMLEHRKAMAWCQSNFEGNFHWKGNVVLCCVLY